MGTHAKVIVCLVLLQFLLAIPSVANPAYFNHDELQMGERAAFVALPHVPWAHFSDFGVSQYRPLAIDVWLALSHWFYLTPQLFHAIYLLIAAVNPVLLYLLVYTHTRSLKVAAANGVVFAILPSTAFVVGWVATIGDIFVVLCGLILGLFLRATWLDRQRLLRYAVWLSLGGAVTAVALASKETAVVFPIALLLVALLLVSPAHAVASLGSGVAVGTYLLLRAPALTAVASEGPYRVRLDVVWEKLLLYVAFPFALPDAELHELIPRWGLPWLLVGLALHALVVLMLGRYGWKWAALYLLAFAIYPLPTLLIAGALPHYLYGAGIPMAMALAVLLLRAQLLVRTVAVGLCLVLAVHGMVLQTVFFSSGVLQDRALTTLAAYETAVVKLPVPEAGPLVIVAGDDTPWWVASRTLFGIRHVRGQLIPQAVTFLHGPEGQDVQHCLRFTIDGYLTPEGTCGLLVGSSQSARQ